MKLTNPIAGMKWNIYPWGNITQWFGENIELYKSLGIGLNEGHNGIDIVAPWGTPILAVSDQLITDCKLSPTGYGKHIRAISLKEGHEYTYGHLSSIEVTPGQEVKAGTMIGKMGNTGFVVSGATPYWEHNPYAGTHLHFGIRKLGVFTGTEAFVTYLGKKYAIYNYDNGCLGGVDPIQFFETTTEGDTEAELKSLQLTVISLANQAIGLLQRLLLLKTKK